MKKIILVTSVILTGSLLFSACNKTKINAKRLDGGDWKIVELSVDGKNEDELPNWKIGDCDAYKESCTGEWKNEEGGIGKFAWQFRNSGEIFEISNQSELSGDHAQDEAVLQCQDFSGIYEVVKDDKKAMEFKSTSTIGFSGKSVIIKIEK